LRQLIAASMKMQPNHRLRGAGTAYLRYASRYRRVVVIMPR